MQRFKKELKQWSIRNSKYWTNITKNSEKGLKKIKKFYKPNRANLLTKFVLTKIEVKKVLKIIRKLGKRNYKQSKSLKIICSNSRDKTFSKELKEGRRV